MEGDMLLIASRELTVDVPSFTASLPPPFVQLIDTTVGRKGATLTEDVLIICAVVSIVILYALLVKLNIC